MFEFLKPFTQIVVTGSGRAGTQIMAQAIAQDLELDYVPETAFNQNNWGQLLNILAQTDRIVAQAPDLWLMMSQLPERAAIVVSRRNLDDIYASWKRHSFLPKDRPEAVYAGLGAMLAMRPHTFWMDYEDLREHPLWIDPEARRADPHWTWRSTKLSEPALEAVSA